MRGPELKKALQQGRPVYGTMISEARSAGIIQILANAGFDFVFIDMEHGPFSVETMADLIRVARLCGICPIVRASDHPYFFLARALDAGAEGLMVPRVETRAQAEEIVRSAKYPPVGRRGCSLSIAHTDYGALDGASYVSSANADNILILQIESRTAVEGIDRICSVAGVDGVVMGPKDLSLSYGRLDQYEAPEIVTAIQTVVDAVSREGIFSGTHVGDISQLEYWREKGMRLLAYSSDIGFLRKGARDAVRRLRGG